MKYWKYIQPQLSSFIDKLQGEPSLRGPGLGWLWFWLFCSGRRDFGRMGWAPGGKSKSSLPNTGPQGDDSLCIVVWLTRLQCTQLSPLTKKLCSWLAYLSSMRIRGAAAGASVPPAIRTGTCYALHWLILCEDSQEVLLHAAGSVAWFLCQSLHAMYVCAPQPPANTCVERTCFLHPKY